MAGKRPAQKGKTIAFVLKGSNSPPSSKKGKGSGFRGAPTIKEVNRGERTLASAQPGSGRMFPPVHGGKPMVIQTKKTLKKNKGPGYVPSASDLTNSPNSNS